MAALGESERLPMVDGIELVFPKLRGTGWRISSNADDRYNCIAWAADVTTDWWWPTEPGPTHWPEATPREVTIEAFREAFTTIGYTVCAGEEFEPGFQKIALFANEQGVPRPAARQLASG